MPEVYEVDLFAPDPYDVSALIISTWACPEDKEKTLRDRLYQSLCAVFIRNRVIDDREWAQQPQLIIPDQACRSLADIRRDTRTLIGRIKRRAIAGDIAAPFLQEAETGTVPPLPPGVGRLTLNRIVAYALPRHGFGEETNMRSRVWRPSKPVLHLCASWVTLSHEHFKENGARLNLLEVMRRPEFLALFLHRAELMEPLIDRSRLNISADELIKFRLLPKGGQKTGDFVN